MKSTASPSPGSREKPIGGARLLVFRILALVAAPALLLASSEVLLRVAGFGEPAGFAVPDETPGFLRSNPRFASLYFPAGFDLRPLNFRFRRSKPANTVRIVVLGESAAQGVPAPQFGFAPQLRALLRSRYPGREFEVLNTGIVAVNSHVIYRIARQLKELSPDFVVIYMGNNEVVGPYGPGCAYLSEMPPLWVIRLSMAVKASRIGQLANRAAALLAGGKHPAAEWGGMQMFVNSTVVADDPRLQAVYRNFEANLRAIVGEAEDAGARTILCTVASNIRDSAPFVSVHGRELSAAELSAWSSAYDRGRREWLLGESARATKDLLEAERIDPRHADTEFMLGRLDLDRGDTEEGRRRLIAAEHWDALRFRPDPAVNEAIRRVARSAGGTVSLLDVAGLLGSDPGSSAPPAGGESFVEHVHLSLEGNYRLARSVAGPIAEALDATGAEARAWIGPQDCAEAVGYTPHERYPYLESVGAIVQHPPFTHQLTYPEDQARLLAELSAAAPLERDPAALGRARSALRSAMARDPVNPDLPRIAQRVDADLGDPAAALSDLRLAESLQPRDFTLATDEAVLLMRLGRTDEARARLQDTASACTAKERALMAPAFADLYTRTGQIAAGRAFLDRVVAESHGLEAPRIARAEFAQVAGDGADAERQYRSILTANPGSRAALEALVRLLESAGRGAEADTLTLAALPNQPQNFDNNMRAARIHGKRGEAEQEAACLSLAESSGPMTSALEGKLSRLLLSMGRTDEALEHLALARRISTHEGDPAVTDQISQVIAVLEQRQP